MPVSDQAAWAVDSAVRSVSPGLPRGVPGVYLNHSHIPS
jgi:hypothetical protein